MAPLTLSVGRSRAISYGLRQRVDALIRYLGRTPNEDEEIPLSTWALAHPPE